MTLHLTFSLTREPHVSPSISTPDRRSPIPGSTVDRSTARSMELRPMETSGRVPYRGRKTLAQHPETVACGEVPAISPMAENICDEDAILRNDAIAPPDDRRNLTAESPAGLAARFESEGKVGLDKQRSESRPSHINRAITSLSRRRTARRSTPGSACRVPGADCRPLRGRAGGCPVTSGLLSLPNRSYTIVVAFVLEGCEN